jgi:hypothetical protein
MKMSTLITQIKVGFVSVFIGLIVISSGCGDQHDGDTIIDSELTTEFKSHPGVPGFDWVNDPLEVTINEKVLDSGIGRDTLDLIVKDLYSYFHTMNTGDSADWVTHLNHFPLHKYSDTATLNTQFAGTRHWKEKGFSNRMGKSEIKFVSKWIHEEDQMVAILGSDIDFYMDFLPHFEGNPDGMRFYLGDKYGSDKIKLNSYNEFDENGDSLQIRNWHAHTYSSLFVITTYDTLHFSFLPVGFNKATFGANLMESNTMLSLLRQSREYDNNQPAEY